MQAHEDHLGFNFLTVFAYIIRNFTSTVSAFCAVVSAVVLLARNVTFARKECHIKLTKNRWFLSAGYCFDWLQKYSHYFWLLCLRYLLKNAPKYVHMYTEHQADRRHHSMTSFLREVCSKDDWWGPDRKTMRYTVWCAIDSPKVKSSKVGEILALSLGKIRLHL